MKKKQFLTDLVLQRMWKNDCVSFKNRNLSSFWKNFVMYLERNQQRNGLITWLNCSKSFVHWVGLKFFLKTNRPLTFGAKTPCLGVPNFVRKLHSKWPIGVTPKLLKNLSENVFFCTKQLEMWIYMKLNCAPVKSVQYSCMWQVSYTRQPKM